MAKQGFWLIAVSLCVGQLFFAGHMGCLVTAGLELVPPHYRGTCQGFIPLFQMLTAFWGAAFCGLISDRLGLPMALLITMLIGCVLGCVLLLVAYRTYLADYEKQRALGTFAVEIK
jgi:MFS family permease